MRRIAVRIGLAAGLTVPLQAARAGTIEISIEQLVYSPAEAHARVGDTVRWVNKDALAHTATARNGDFDVTIAPNKSATFVVKKPGDVAYYCRFHPNMTARLSVTKD